ncbi:MAG TPA: RluA family pseudouridine synthase [Candidatus Enterenecus stercoripullorum]|nr:RluA family pseudouridine synthase [Candidatus Enterenecus stercoripullorum]
MEEKEPIQILYQDKRILVCLKPPGVASVDQPGGLPDLLRRQLGGEGKCLRTVHRLDQPVGGVMVLARSRMAAQLLSQQVENRSFHKEYLAVLSGIPEQETGTMADLLGYDRTKRRAFVAQEPGREVREAILHYRVLDTVSGHALVGVELETGRTHQIRIQFAARGLPLVGDRKYGAPPFDLEGIALWSHMLEFGHPQTGKRISFSALPPEEGPWSWFERLKTKDTE